MDQTKNTFTPTGNSVGMDPANTKMAVVMETQGPDAAAKAMLDDCGNNYFAMRAKYG